MEHIYTARMEAIEEDKSLEVVAQLAEISTEENEEQYVESGENDNLNFKFNGVSNKIDTIHEYDRDDIFAINNNPLEKRPSDIKIDKNVDDLVNQILSPDTAEFINFEKQMKEMSQKKPLPDHSSEVDEIDEEFIQKKCSQSEGIEKLGRRLSTSSNSTTFSVSDLTQIPSAPSSEYNKPIEHKRSMSSMELQEQQALERMALQTELEIKLEERKRSLNSSLSSRDSDSGSVLSGSGANDKCDDKDDPLHLMERRQFRSFNRADEYLYAMKEDLAEWLNMLYTDIEIDAENFMDKLETGEILVKHANCVRCKVVELLEQIAAGLTKQKPPPFSVPDKDLPLRSDVQPGTWFARDNVYNFIKFCRLVGVMECIMFETEDLVCRKNEKHVVLTLLEVARRGAKIGMLAPMLVQFEQEIDREIAREERERRKEEKEEERRQKEEEKRQRKEEERRRKQQQQEQERQERLQRELAEREQQLLQHQANNFDSMQVELGDLDVLRLADVSDADLIPDCIIEDTEEEEDDDFEEEEEEEEEPEDEDYAMPIGPLPQMIFNDLKSLDEMVRELVSECQCPTQFPMIRVSEGKYRIGDTQVLIFVRILRNHVMVRVGGGWDTLQHYLDKHDPCRCRAGHRSSTGAHLHLGRTGSKNPMNVNVCYDRSDSPATVAQRRRSSTQNINQFGASSRRSASLTPNSAARTLNNDCGSGSGSNNSTPRGSLSNINSIRGRSASINTANLKHQTPALKTAILNNSRFSSGNNDSYNGNGGVHLTSSNRRSPYSPLVSRRESSINELVVDNAKSQKHKEISKSSSLQPTSQFNGNFVRGSSDNSASSKQLQKSLSSAIPTLNKGDSLKISAAQSSKAGCENAVHMNSNNGGREAFLCDSSSEVSDEGYKSSQGGCSNSFLINKDKLHVENGRGHKENTSISKDSSSPNSSSADIALSTSSHEDRPMSSLTVASECSSTISSEEEEHKNIEIKNAMEVNVDPSSSSPPPPPLPQSSGKVEDLALVNQLDLPPPPMSPTNSSISEDGDTWQTPTNKLSITDDPEVSGTEIINQDEMKSSKTGDKSSTSNNGRIGRFFNSINKKFKPKDSDKNQQMIDCNNKIANDINGKTYKKSEYSNSTPKNSINGGLNDRPSSRQSIGSLERPKRCRSASGDHDSMGLGSGFSRSVTERRSYRGPSATSRYMQAAEAYTAKSRNARVAEANNKASSRNVWNGMSNRGREGSSNSGFTWNDSQRPYSRTGMSTPGGSRPASRTASASPGPCRRQQKFSNGQISRGNSSNALKYESNYQLQPPQSKKPFPTSTHSTPCKKPQPKISQTSTSSGVKKSSISSKSNQALEELEAEDDLILKRMEEILLTYKSKVEDHLAAEGRELPKEIFEDFTSQWVQNVRQKPEKRDMATKDDEQGKLHSNTSPVVKSKSNGCIPTVLSSPSIRTTPIMRKDKKEGIEKTRIPMPTYFNSPIPTETDI